MSTINKNIKKEKKQPKLLISIFKKIIIVFLDILLLYLFIASFANIFFPKNSAKWVGLAGFPVASGSMSPFINGPKENIGGEGDFIFIRGVWNCTKLKPGDIVVFQNPQYSSKSQLETPRFIIHRVVSNDTKKKIIATWGDKNDIQLSYEKNIPYDNIVGKFILKDRKIIPSIRRIINYLKEYPLYLSLTIIYLIIMFLLLRMIKKNINILK
ncbi:S26 family signal peptidase [Candidatus Phytoplasma solani]|uniref:signal peptidase I n=1 Tax=Candidatus Phytoplasma solani TaxID=69896 RepID=UPI0032DAFEA3